VGDVTPLKLNVIRKRGSREQVLIPRRDNGLAGGKKVSMKLRRANLAN